MPALRRDASESRRGAAGWLLARCVTRPSHMAASRTPAAASVTRLRTATGTRCSSTACFAYVSANSFVTRSTAVSRDPSPRTALPISSRPQCAGIHTNIRGGTSSMELNSMLKTRAKGRAADVAHSFPRCTASTHGLQSRRKSEPGSAMAAAWSNAQDSVPGMSTIHGGGSP